MSLHRGAETLRGPPPPIRTVCQDRSIRPGVQPGAWRGPQGPLRFDVIREKCSVVQGVHIIQHRGVTCHRLMMKMMMKESVTF